MFRLVSISIACTMLLIPIAGFSSNIISNGPLLIAVSAGLAYIVIPAFLLHIWPAAPVVGPKSMQDALWDGEIQTVAYRITGAAEIEELEDEGRHFLLSIGSEETLCLSGQYLYDLIERSAFPSEEIRVFRNTVTGAMYGLESFGQRLENWPIFAPFNSDNLKSNIEFEDGLVVLKPIAKIVEEFGLNRQIQGHALVPKKK